MKIRLFSLFLALFAAARLAAQETAEHYTSLGDAAAAKKDYQGALDNYAKATKLNDKYIPAYLHRAATNAATGEWDIVMGDLGVAVLYDPKNPVIYDTRGNYRRTMPSPNLDGALADHKKAIELDPKNAAYQADLGADLAAKGDDTAALAAFNAALALDAKNPTALLGRGILSGKKGDHAAAIADLDQAITLLPDEPAAYEARAKARLAKGDKAGAAADKKQAKKLKPEADDDNED